MPLFMVFALIILVLLMCVLFYFLLSERERYIRAINKEFRFNILITCMICAISIFILSSIIAFLAIFLLRKLELKFEVFAVIFLLLIIVFIITLKKVILVSLDKNKFEKKKISNVINYKQSKFKSYFYLLVGLLGTIKIIFFPEDDLSNTIHIIVGIIIMSGSFIMMIRSLTQPKVSLNEYYLEFKTNWLTLDYGILEWEEINYIEINKGILGYQSISIINYDDGDTELIKEQYKINKEIIFSGLKNMDDFIKNIIEQSSNAKVVERLWIGGRISKYLKNHLKLYIL